MSRTYRIRVRKSIQVKDSLHKTVQAADQVGTELEILEVLPKEEMAELLRQELLGRGFERQGKDVVRTQNGVTVTVEPETGTVTVQSELTREVQVEGKKTGVYEEHDPLSRRAQEARKEKLRQDLKAELRTELEQQAGEKAARLQTQATDKLEAELCNLAPELDQAVNRVTAEALKRKAAQMGKIKEISEDPQAGSLTIVLEV